MSTARGTAIGITRFRCTCKYSVSIELWRGTCDRFSQPTRFSSLVATSVSVLIRRALKSDRSHPQKLYCAVFNYVYFFLFPPPSSFLCYLCAACIISLSCVIAPVHPPRVACNGVWAFDVCTPRESVISNIAHASQTPTSLGRAPAQPGGIYMYIWGVEFCKIEFAALMSGTR